jgi:archaeosine synthase
LKFQIDIARRYGFAREGSLTILEKQLELPSIAGVLEYQNFTDLDYEIVISFQQSPEIRNTKNLDIKSRPDFMILHGQNPLLVNRNGSNGSNIEVENNYKSQSSLEFFIPGTLNYPESFAALKISHESLIPTTKYAEDELSINCELVMNSHHDLTSGPGLVVLYNSPKLLNNPRTLVNRVLSILHRSSPDKILYLPGVATVNNLAILVYLGVDIFDNIQCIHHARSGKLMTLGGIVHYSNAQNALCSCPGCLDRLKLVNNTNSPFNDQNKGLSNALFGSILKHNDLALRSELSLIKTSLATGTLRELVEARMVSEPNLSALIRIMDLEFFPILEPYFPVYRKGKFITTSREALNRVEVLRFRDRVLNRYQKPEGAKILVLFPCSARKPYSTSKSHKLFFRAVQSAIQNLKNKDVLANLLHEVIVTSPLGLVPRELELVYPAQQYDIPVTGHWFEDELVMINEELTEYLSKNQYDNIIIHLPPDLSKPLSETIKSKFGPDINISITCGDTPTKKSALEQLSEQLHKILLKYEQDPKTMDRLNNRLRTLKGIVGFQFGAAGYELLNDVKVRGKYPYLKIFGSKTQNGRDVQLGMLTSDRGFISLTLPGAKRIYELPDFDHIVEIDDFVPKGSVMAVGVENASDIIRSGDEVVIVFGHEVRGVGQAVVSGPEMVSSNRGMAVKVRHHK